MTLIMPVISNKQQLPFLLRLLFHPLRQCSSRHNISGEVNDGSKKISKAKFNVYILFFNIFYLIKSLFQNENEVLNNDGFGFRQKKNQYIEKR